MCLKLRLFQEAMGWCDEGLLVRIWGGEGRGGEGRGVLLYNL